MKQPSPQIKALAEKYSKRIQKASDAHDRKIKALYQEYKHKHECLTKTIEGQDGTKENYHPLLVPSFEPQNRFTLIISLTRKIYDHIFRTGQRVRREGKTPNS